MAEYRIKKHKSGKEVWYEIQVRVLKIFWITLKHDERPIRLHNFWEAQYYIELREEIFRKGEIKVTYIDVNVNK